MLTGTVSATQTGTKHVGRSVQESTSTPAYFFFLSHQSVIVCCYNCASNDCVICIKNDDMQLAR